MRKLKVFQADAFTNTHFAGNPAGVVFDAHLLADMEMQYLSCFLNEMCKC